MQRDLLVQIIDCETQINEVVRKVDSRMHIELECVFNVEWQGMGETNVQSMAMMVKHKRLDLINRWTLPKSIN